MDPILITVIVVLLSFLVLKKLTASKLNLPPGPTPWPYIGNLPVLGNQPWISLGKLAKQFGDIMYVKFGSMPVVVLSSPKAFAEFYQEHGMSFTHRPDVLLARLISDEGKVGIVCSNGEAWRKNRKLCMQMLLNKNKLPGYQSLATSETQKMLLQELPKSMEASKSKIVDNWGEMFFKLIGSIMLRLCVGESSLPAENPFSDKWYHTVERLFALNDKPYLGDFLAGLSHFPSAVYNEYVAAIDETRQGIAHFIDVGTKERAKRKEKGDSTSLLDQFLDMPPETRLTKDEILANLMEIILAASETTIDTMHWAVIALANYPECQDKLREEVTRVLGDTNFSEDRLSDLPYLAAFFNEALRWGSVIKLPIGRSTPEDMKIRGYDIPKGTTIMINLHALQKDEKQWADVNTFNPERFIERPVNSVECHDAYFAPFGIGPRACPGARFAAMMFYTIVCMLVQNYKIERPGPELLDITPLPKNTAGPAVPARVVINPC